MSLPEPHGSEDEAELRKRIASLERKLWRKTRALAAAHEEFQSLIYAITHDFRGPLRAILSSAMFLREDHGEALGADGRAELDRQDSNVRKINALLDELLKVSRLSRLEFNPARHELSELASKAAMIVGPDIPDTLEVEGGITVDGDAELLTIALQQVIDNSQKFRSEVRPLKIQLGKSEKGYFIRDNGIGFEPEKGDRIFLPFERLHGNNFQGAGIGLAIFKRIVDRHGGTVGFDSEPDHGTTIYFDLEEAI